MAFNLKRCDIPTIWCGDAPNPPQKRKNGSYYYKTGTRYECMKKGFGAGTHTERKAHLPKSSLQQIKYVGEKHESDFKKKGIHTLSDLLDVSRNKNKSGIKKMLKKILTNSNGVVDARAYNSTLVFLFKNGIHDLPKCKHIKANK